MISVTDSLGVPFGEVRLGAGTAAALNHAPTLTPLRIATDSRTVVSEVPEEWGEIRQKLELPPKCLRGLCFPVSCSLPAAGGRWRAGSLPKVVWPDEMALELEFQTLDPSCLLPCIVVGEVCQSQGKGLGHHSCL